MADLRIAIVVLGAFAILGILAHGLWVSRKNNSHADAKSNPQGEGAQASLTDRHNKGEKGRTRQMDNATSTGKKAVITDPSFDDDMGDGFSHQIDPADPLLQPVDANVEPQPSKEPQPNQEPRTRPVSVNKVTQTVVNKPKPQVPVVEEPKEPYGERPMPEPLTPPSLKQEPIWDPDIPEPPASLLQDTPNEPVINDKVSLDEPAIGTQANAEQIPPVEEEKGLAAQARRLVGGRKDAPRREAVRKEPAAVRTEPQVTDEQLDMDFDGRAKEEPRIDESEAMSNEPPQQEVLVLNVKAPDDVGIPGAALLPMLLTLGLKFGDQDIFHRHVNSNGKGPVLFSLANMFKPGVFDIDNMENFTTQGVSLFMILPIEGDAHQVFNMMHNAARKLAEEFDAQILDGRRSVLTKQGLQQYVEKIREFERKRMIRRA